MSCFNISGYSVAVSRPSKIDCDECVKMHLCWYLPCLDYCKECQHKPSPNPKSYHQPLVNNRGIISCDGKEILILVAGV